MKFSELASSKDFKFLILKIFGVAAFIVVLGFITHSYQTTQAIKSATGDLVKLSTAKVDMINDYRIYRTADAEFLFFNQSFIQTLDRYIQGDVSAKSALDDWIMSLYRRNHYDAITIFDYNTGNAVYVAGNNNPDFHSEMLKRGRKAFERGKVSLGNFQYYPRTDKLHLEVFAPLFKNDRTGKTPIAIVVFAIDPSYHLFKRLKEVNYSTNSTEAYLVEISPDSTRYLSELKFRANSAFKLNMPTSEYLKSIISTPGNDSGVVVTVDYRPEPVISRYAKVPGTPWVLLCETDMADLHGIFMFADFYLALFYFAAFIIISAIIIWLHRERMLKQKNLNALHEVERLNRVHSVLSQVNQAIVRTKNRDVLLREICRIAVTALGYKVCYIGLLNRYSNMIEEAATSGEATDFAEGLLISIDPASKYSYGPTGTALRAKKPYICNNLKFHEGLAPWQEKINHYHLRSSASFPLIVQNEVYGSLTYYSDQTNIFVNAEIALLTELAEDLAYALENYDKDEARAKVINDLAESESRFRRMFENHQAVMWLLDPSTAQILDANYAAVKFYGYSREELTQMNLLDFNPLSKEELMGLSVKTTQKTANLFVFEHRIASGELRTVQVNSSPITWGGKTVLFSIIYDITETSKSQRALTESENRLSVVIDATGAGTWDWNITTGDLIVNEYWAMIAGYTLAELSPVTFSVWERLCHPDDLILSNKLIEEHVQNPQKRYSFVVRLKHKSGDWVYVLDTGRVIEWDEDGNPLRMVGTHIDITEKRNIELALKQAEDNYKIVAENIHETIILTDLNFHVTWVSPSVEKSRGFSFVELSEIPLEKQLTRESAVRIMRKINENVTKFRLADPTDEIVITDDVEVLRKDGSTFWSEISFSVLRDEEGIATGFLGFGRDITERKKAEEEIKLQSAALNSAANAITITDRDGRILWTNNAFTFLTGYSFDEAVGHTFSLLRSGAHPKEFITNLWATILKGETWRGEMINKRKDGVIYHEEQTITPMIDSYGNIKNFISIKFDITERKRTEKELIKAKEVAENASRAKSNFMANMSHELRTPMNGILGYSEILRSDSDIPQVIKIAESIYNSATRLMDTINLLLDMSSIETDSVEFHMSRTNIVPIVEYIVKTYDKNALSKGLYLKLDVKDSVVESVLDDRMFRAIISALINNAIKFTDNGGVTIHVYSDVYKDVDVAVVEVVDTGIGIAPDCFQVIFDEFRQVSEGMERNYEGTGLGLTIARKFIRSMGGEIDLSSALGKGSTFYAFMPLAKEDMRAIPTLSTSMYESLPTESYAALGKLPSVLYFEDDETTQDLVEIYLGDISTTDFANTGDDGIKLAISKQYDLVLMDINLGRGLNGLEIVKILRGMENYKEVPIIAITAYALPSDERDFLARGCTAYLSKPFSKIKLRELVAKLIVEK